MWEVGWPGVDGTDGTQFQLGVGSLEAWTTSRHHRSPKNCPQPDPFLKTAAINRRARPGAEEIDPVESMNTVLHQE